MKIICVLVSLLPTACFQPVTGVQGSEPATKQEWTLRLSPEAALDACEPSVTLHLVADGNDEVPPPENIAVVEGRPSTVSLGKYMEGETTEALAERLVPFESFVEKNHIQLRSRGLFALGQTYTLISNLGVLGVVVVAPRKDRSYLSRLWPPADSAYGVVQAIFCGERAPRVRSKIELFPPDHFATIELGLDSTGDLKENCLRLIPDAPGKDVLMPPVNVEGLALEPSPFGTSVELAELLPAECGANESTFGPGCVSVEGDRAVVRGPIGMTFWAFINAQGRHFQTLESNGRFVVPELRQLSDGQLNATVFDLAGRSMPANATLHLPPPSARVVITEVLANSLGSEPAEEWVELMNAGDAAITMQDYVLADSGGKTVLPPMSLGAGAYVLLVREDYVGGTAGDVAPAQGAVVVRLAQLGKNGLSNTGETITLLNAEGKVVSSFPARASERAGTSVARRDPNVLDDDLTGFISHAPPGASPGGPNEVE